MRNVNPAGAKCICFDLEGPLSPQDNAYQLMKLFPDGDKVFEVISRYDDLLTLEEREGYEPGDTLALIAPFLIYHHISEEDILKLGKEAKLVDGAYELISQLRSGSWEVFCISTSYEQYASIITRRLGIDWQNVASTHFPLDEYRQILAEENLNAIAEVEREMLSLRPVKDDRHIKESLDQFFWEELPPFKMGEVMMKVKPVGGRRKVKALENFARAQGQPVANFVVVGDSITDYRMLDAVSRAGGVSIAFNANEYALPYSTVSLASTHLSDLLPILDAWKYGGREAVEEVVRKKEEAGGEEDRNHFHWLAGNKEWERTVEIHRRIRRLVREEAAKLG